MRNIIWTGSLCVGVTILGAAAQVFPAIMDAGASFTVAVSVSALMALVMSGISLRLLFVWENRAPDLDKIEKEQ